MARLASRTLAAVRLLAATACTATCATGTTQEDGDRPLVAPPSEGVTISSTTGGGTTSGPGLASGGAGGDSSSAASGAGGASSSAASGAGGASPATTSGTGAGGAASGAGGSGGEAPSASSSSDAASSSASVSASSSDAASSSASASVSSSASSGGGGAPPACASDAACDDGIVCNGAEHCDPSLGCQAGPIPSCDDGVACTTDVCDLGSDACAHVPVDKACDDGSLCDGAESCDPKQGCTKGTPPVCDDGIACTLDGCDDVGGACTHTASDAMCDNGSFCDGIETCDPKQGCMKGMPVLCSDGIACTADACDDAAAACVAVPIDAACQDGSFCDGVETCAPGKGDPVTGCAPGKPLECPSDGIACTDDVCDEGAMACVHALDAAQCLPGETCVVAGGGCVPGKACASDAECQDGDACNGSEVCDAVLKVCQAGVAKSCNDGVACTVDACDPGTGTCSHAPVHAVCDDGFACNGSESCTAAGCAPGTPVSCGDGIGCTLDQCDEPTGACLHLPLDGICDDGLFCTGLESCDPTKGCVAGKPPACNDGVACTVDACDPALDACAAKPDDGACPCTQTCDAVTGCGNHCVPATCQGKTYACGNCLDDDGDCRVDAADAMCLGACDNSEASLHLQIPGGNSAPCKQDCFFDGDTGAGNDGCYWSHSCDPLEVGPKYDPEGAKCAYDPGAQIPGTSLACATAMAGQDALCTGYCAPLTPNGCDCFGCCLVPGAPQAVWLGSTDAKGDPTCTTDTLADPTKCRPCTQVPACLNACETCELCLGKDTLPPECGCQECPLGAALCGGPCGGACAFGEFCLSGCCVPAP